MTRQEFVKLSYHVLKTIDDQLGDLEHEDLDIEWAGDVMNLCFADGSRFVINAHSAALQMWMAAGTQAWHFDYDKDHNSWIAKKSNEELFGAVTQVVEAKLGCPIPKLGP